MTLFVTAAAFAQSGGNSADTAAAPSTSRPARPFARVALEARIQAGPALTQSPDRVLKAQPAGEAAAGVIVALGGYLAVAASFGAHLALPSDVSYGFRYRGMDGADLRAELSGRLPLHPATSTGLAVEIALGAGVRYERYLLTSLYLFYPVLLAEPALEIPLNSKQSLAVGLPVQWWLRRDGATTWALGASVAWRFYPGGLP